MRPRALSLLAATAAGLVTAPATANHLTYEGGCVFAGAATDDGNPLVRTAYEGPLAGAVRATRPDVLVSLNCALVVNGVVTWHGEEVTGVGATATASVPILAARPSDVVRVCDWVRVEDLSGHAQSFTACDAVTFGQAPSNGAVDVVESTCRLAADPATCALTDVARAKVVTDLER